MMANTRTHLECPSLDGLYGNKSVSITPRKLGLKNINYYNGGFFTKCETAQKAKFSIVQQGSGNFGTTFHRDPYQGIRE